MTVPLRTAAIRNSVESSVRLKMRIIVVYAQKPW